MNGYLELNMKINFKDPPLYCEIKKLSKHMYVVWRIREIKKITVIYLYVTYDVHCTSYIYILHYIMYTLYVYTI